MTPQHTASPQRSTKATRARETFDSATTTKHATQEVSTRSAASAQPHRHCGPCLDATPPSSGSPALPSPAPFSHITSPMPPRSLQPRRGPSLPRVVGAAAAIGPRKCVSHCNDVCSSVTRIREGTIPSIATIGVKRELQGGIGTEAGYIKRPTTNFSVVFDRGLVDIVVATRAQFRGRTEPCLESL